jgi:cytidine deaminase
MRIKSISIPYKEFDTDIQLETSDRELLDAAKISAINAYAPYSKFRVGAALRLESGIIVTGVNIENAAFPSGICAERSAVANAVSNHPKDKPEAIAIVAMNDNGFIDEAVSPCGNCRQVIAEEEFRHKKKIKIILGGKNRILVIDSIGDLLPLQFNQSNLKVNLP